MPVRKIRDGLSQTVALSESLLGRPIGLRAPREEADPQFVYTFVRSIPLTEEACRTTAFWNYTDPRGFSWANGEFRCALYNHHWPPNSPEYDCLAARVLGPPSVIYSSYGWRTARSMHLGGVNVVLLDTAVRFIPDDIDRQVWRALATRAGGD